MAWLLLEVRMPALRRNWWLVSAGTAVLLLALAIVVAQWAVMEMFGDEYRRFESIQVGMAESEVVKALGPPLRAYLRDTAPANYYEPGYSYKRRDISNKVFIYIGTEPIAYVYFDHSDRVDYVFVGGS
jgi:hypothetical protein